MNTKKKFLTRSFVVIILCMVILGAVLGAGVYFGGQQLTRLLTPEAGAGASITIPWIDVTVVVQSLADAVRSLDWVLTQYPAWMFGVSILIFSLFGVFVWLFLYLSVSSLFGDAVHVLADAQNIKTDVTETKDKKKDYADQRIEQERKRRLFLHVLSVLQREGRLLDFFAEELDLYDDEQIGAAVRSIQEDCKKSMEKYFAPGPIMDKEEGDIVEVAAGFDPDAIKLTGNVSGNPPFKGVLRHRGWRAARIDLPKLSDVRDPSIISPAEIEIE